jgi:hypothetical protein
MSPPRTVLRRFTIKQTLPVVWTAPGVCVLLDDMATIVYTTTSS